MMHRLNLNMPHFAATTIGKARFDKSLADGLPKADYFQIRVNDDEYQYFQLNRKEMAEVSRCFQELGGEGDFSHVKLDSLSLAFLYSMEVPKEELTKGEARDRIDTAKSKYQSPILDCVVQLLKQDKKLEEDFVPAVTIFA